MAAETYTFECSECGEPVEMLVGYKSPWDHWHGDYQDCIAALKEKIDKLEAKNKELKDYIDKLHAERG